MSVVGCTDDDGNMVKPPTTVFAPHHEAPAWSTLNQLAYTDNGFTCVGDDGSALADPDLAGLWVLDFPSGQSRRILPYGFDADWTQDGMRIAFVHNAHIYVVERDGTNLRQLTDEGENGWPRWDPQGQRICYTSSVDDANGAQLVWVMNADGSGMTDISRHGVGEWLYPDWSPDGLRIIHTRFVPGLQYSELFTMTASGEDARRLTTNSREERWPQYSPGGLLVAFSARSESGGGVQVWTMNADGTGVDQLTQRGGINPTWSPDGSEVAYVAGMSATNMASDGVIWTINVTTGLERQLTVKWPEACP